MLRSSASSTQSAAKEWRLYSSLAVGCASSCSRSRHSRSRRLSRGEWRVCKRLNFAFSFTHFNFSVICFNVAIIRMTNLRTSPLYTPNSTTEIDYASFELPLADRRFIFSPLQRSLLFSCKPPPPAILIHANNDICLATFLSPVTVFWLVAWSMRRFGTYKTQIACGVVTSVFTAATPFIVAYLPFAVLIATRYIQGIPLCNLYPVVVSGGRWLAFDWPSGWLQGVLVAEWSGKTERGLFVSVCSLTRRSCR